MAEIEKKKVSELTEETNPSGFWIFGYKELANGAKQSVKVLFDRLLDVIYNVANGLMLERRISLVLQNEEQRMLFGEATRIYGADVENVSKLEVSIDGEATYTEIPLDGSEIDFTIPAKTKATFRVSRQSDDIDMFIYLYAKVIVQ